MQIENSSSGDMGLRLVMAGTVILLVSIFPPVWGSAQEGSPGQDSASGSHLRQEGKLVTVRISRGSPVHIFVAGREEAKFDPSLMKVTIRRLKPYPGKVLTADKQGDYFTVSDQEDLKTATMLEVVTRVQDKNETFRFEVRPALP